MSRVSWAGKYRGSHLAVKARGEHLIGRHVMVTCNDGLPALSQGAGASADVGQHL